MLKGAYLNILSLHLLSARWLALHEFIGIKAVLA